ncbi:MAG: SH3 domain-containing protein [Eubacterium sp.]|nr:SH3 domain-containing protein [Eubacterium sp.]
MNKKLVSIMSISAIVATTLFGNVGQNITQADAKTTKIKLNKSKATITVGKKLQLRVKNGSKKAKISWKSSNKSIVSVNKKGKISGKKPGNAKVIAKYKYKRTKKILSCKIKVKASSTIKVSNPAVTPRTKIVYVLVTPTPARPTIPPIATPIPDNNKGNLTYQGDVTGDMAKASYWINRIENPDKVLIDAQGIAQMNQKMTAKAECKMSDLLSQSEHFNQTKLKENLAACIDSEVGTARLGTREKIYADGELIDNIPEYLASLKKNINDAETKEDAQIEYGLCVNRCDVKMAPESRSIGWSATDADDEFNNSALMINEPVIVKMTTADDKYVYVMSNIYTGWTEKKNVAICKDRDEWLQMWNGDPDKNIVVTTSRITLAASNFAKDTSKLELMLGTVLPLVPKDEMPENINELGTWYNYVAYVPTRDESGKMVRQIVLIPMHNYVSVGYLPFTQRNILQVAFSCLGERYGWGGMLDAWDCSSYTRAIYRCFGFELPRNTTWQAEIPSDNIVLENMKTDEKINAINSLEPGALLMFKGHITMYIGKAGDKQYVISDMGSAAEASNIEADIRVRSIYNVSVNSLDIRRRDGSTWLDNMKIAIRPWKY